MREFNDLGTSIAGDSAVYVAHDGGGGREKEESLYARARAHFSALAGRRTGGGSRGLSR